MDERRDRRAGPPVAAAPAPPRHRADRRAERAAAKRARTRRGQAIAAVSTIVVLGGIAALILTSPGWPAVRDTFFDAEEFKESFPDILKAFWLDVRVFCIVEVAVLILGLVVALMRTVNGAGAVPAAAARGRLHRRLPRRPDDPAHLPDRLRRPGAGPTSARPWRLPTEPVVLGGIALALSYSAYVSEVYRAGLKSIHRGQRDAALAVGLTESQAMRHVILPQAVRRVGPPLLNDFISLQKDVALIAILGVTGEAFRTAQIRRPPDFNYTPLIAAALLYLAITIPMARLLDRWDAARAGAPMSAAPVLEIRGVTKSFGEREVLHGIDLEVAEHEAVARDRRLGLGQVDAAALRRPARGDRRRRHLPRRRGDHRPLGRRRSRSAAGSGFVFQAYNLFPHLNVLENVVLGMVQGPRRRRAPRPRTRRARSSSASGSAAARTTIPTGSPAASSSGSRSRARSPPGRGRCCSTRSPPRSTPSSSARCCRRSATLKAEGVTMLIATHEMSFAREVADRVCFLHEGRLRARSARPSRCSGSPARAGDEAVPAPAAGGGPGLGEANGQRLELVDERRLDELAARRRARSRG